MGVVITYPKYIIGVEGKPVLNQLKLSNHFRVGEFACPCGECKIIKISTRLVNACEIIRTLINRPVKITSGFRCEEHNVEVGGAPASQHLLGNACDLRTQDRKEMNEFVKFAMQIPDIGAIGRYEKNGDLQRIHIDFRLRLKDHAPVTWTKEIS